MNPFYTLGAPKICNEGQYAPYSKMIACINCPVGKLHIILSSLHSFRQLLKICVIYLRAMKLVVVDIIFQSKNLMRFGNTNKRLIKQKQGKLLSQY